MSSASMGAAIFVDDETSNAVPEFEFVSNRLDRFSFARAENCMQRA
jgi:hypothetical protein